jgi:NADPH:quinone reductase-like Zn-dependent oxidoreductase
MKAIVYENYGSPEVLHLKEVEMPVPGDNEILVRIYATAVSSGDVRLRKADPFAVRFVFGFLHPRNKILGMAFAGEIEAIGKDVSLFKEGDQVYGTTGASLGAYAEYKCLPQDAVVAIKPSKITYKEAAAIPFGAITALHFLNKARIQPGQKILIYGASGAIGTAAVQLAKYFGAEVTGVCSTKNFDMVKSLGATKVFDYKQDDLTKIDERFDVIFDTVGKSSFKASLKSLDKKGLYLRAVHMALSPIVQGLWANITSSKKVVGGVVKETTEALSLLNGLIETGELRPVIDRCYPLEDIAEAHSYVERGHKKGNVVITV